MSHRPAQIRIASLLGLALALLVLHDAAVADQSPPGCSVNNLQADISVPPTMTSVPCGTAVPITVRVFNGTDAGACDVTDTPVNLTCPDPATGTATGPVTALATGDDFPAVPPSSTTYPAVNCTIGATNGACHCGGNGIYQARVEAGPGTLHLNPNSNADTADIIKTVSIQCVEEAAVRHEQCYETRRQPFTSRTVTLTDEFGSTTATVRRMERLCAPTDKNDEDPTAPTDPQHLTGYELTNTKPSYLPVNNVSVTDQFGTLTFNLTRLARLLVPAAKSLTAPPAPITNPTVTHFSCYAVKHVLGTPRFTTHSVTLTDQFGAKTVTVDRPLVLCVPTEKNAEDSVLLDGTGALLCYDVRVRENLKISPVFTTDQFGSFSTSLIRRDELCTPATVGGVSPSSSTTTTSTTTTSSTTSTTGSIVGAFVDGILGLPVT